jgi:hypothetical protein
MMDPCSDGEQHAGNDKENRRKYDGAGWGKGTPGYDIVRLRKAILYDDFFDCLLSTYWTDGLTALSVR